MRQQERLRLSRAEPEEGDGLARHLAFLGAEIAAIEGRIRQILRDGEDLARQERLLRSVPGIGPVAAAVLLGLMPELGRLSGKAAAALAGLAPATTTAAGSAACAASAAAGNAAATPSTWPPSPPPDPPRASQKQPATCAPETSRSSSS
ncbi:transposase [Hyphomicrobiales bacterium]|nr:transposase [Hyphomicrobiales bacterium]